VYEVKEVLEDLNSDTYQRGMIEAFSNKYEFAKRGTYQVSNSIKFVDVPLITPNGDELVEAMNFEIKKG